MTVPGGMAGGDPARLLVRVCGRVQGVGFRWWTSARADELSLDGSAENMPDGTVAIAAEGPAGACRELLAALRSADTPGAVSAVDAQWADPRGEEKGFRIR